MKFDLQTITNSLISFSFVLIVTSCGGGGEQGQMRPGQGQAQPYPVLELQPRSIMLTSSYPATLEGEQTVEIRPRVQGYITAMRVDEGDVVEKGQVLFELNSEQYEQEVRSARADIEAAKAGVSTAEDEVQRLQSLVEKEIISEYRLQTAKNQLETQRSALAQAEARFENAQVNLGYTNVKSPANGIIGNIPYRIGSLVNSSIQQPLTVVSDISQVHAYFSMSEGELLEMSRAVSDEGGNKTIQQRVADMPPVNLILQDNTIYQHQGTLKLASGLINTETGSASFRALFPNPNEVLRSGGSGSVQIPVSHDSTIVIPQKATYEIQNKRFVYTVTDSNTVQSSVIETAPLSTDQLFVVQSGLQNGDRIVTEGMGNLQADMKIEPQLVNADSLYEEMTVEDQKSGS